MHPRQPLPSHTSPSHTYTSHTYTSHTYPLCFRAGADNLHSGNYE